MRMSGNSTSQHVPATPGHAAKCDAVVVGGGPAGSVSALLLARAGYDVILLDRARFPRAKACGDCISPQANLLLEQIGLLHAVNAAHPARLEGWRIFAPSGASFSASFADVVRDPALQRGIAINREILDALLLAAARSAGVRVMTGFHVDDVLFENDRVTGVVARTNGSVARIVAPLTIGADGLNSTIRRRTALSLRTPKLRKVALTAHVRTIDVGAFGEMHLGPGACVGLAPIDDRREMCNLTLVVDADRHGRTLAGKTAAAFRDWIEKFPALTDRFDGSAIDGPFLAAGPFDWPTRGIVTEGAALVGDAAGYYDPFTGQGIYQAIAGAITLSRAADNAFRSGRIGQPLHDYARAHLTMTQNARRVQRGIESICARSALAELCIGTLQRAPRAAATLIGVTGDVLPAYRLLSPVVLFSFLGAMTRSGL
jgi:flavin-dependent dehydrogenase